MDRDLVDTPAVLARNSGALFQPTLKYHIAHYLCTHQDVCVVVQVGAYDGERVDPLCGWLRQGSIRAVLVEPQPRPFQKLQALYAGCPGVSLVNAAVAERDGVARFYKIRDDADVPDWVRQCASFDPKHILELRKWFPQVESLMEAIEVQTLSFTTLLREQDIAKVNVLVIDCEGYDAKLLEFFDVKRRRPDIIQFEHKCLQRQAWKQCLEMLVNNGYQVSVLGEDTIASVVDSRQA